MNFNEFGGLNSGILRTVNEALVLNLVRERQPISRVAIARTTGLKESTISSIVRELLEQNLIVETDFGDSGGGRRPLMLDLKRDRSRTIGVDLGCHRTIIGVSDFSGDLVGQLCLPTDPNPAVFLDQLADAIEQAIKEFVPSGMPVEGIGFGMPGLMDRTEGRIIYAANLDWHNVAVGAYMRQRFSYDLLFEDNVRCAGLAAVWFGSLNDLSHGSAIVLVVDEGIGCALIIDGHLYRGATLGAGQAGHISIVRDGPVCRCGNRGCWEMMASNDATLARYNRETGSALGSFAQLIERLHAGDAAAVQAIRQTGRYLGDGIAVLANLLNPELLILDGPLTESWTEIEPEIQMVLEQRTLKENRESLILRPSPIRKNTTLSGAISLALCRNFAVARVSNTRTPQVANSAD
ncbi:MAG TPA: ROK family transcriptional regulator [Bryobacteraceae bacterium]|jgi:predicted NBD/HSP70 family sugar kinase